MMTSIFSHGRIWLGVGWFLAVTVTPVAASSGLDLDGLRARAAAGDNGASFELGRALLRGEGVARDLPGALLLLRPAAEAGHPGAMGAYGVMMVRGLAVEADQKSGFAWIQKAAQAGDLSALLNQGIMTLRGQGTTADTKAGLALIEQAAERGSLEAQARLAEAYFLGEDGLVVKSEEAAAPWALRAAEAGHAWSQNLVGTMKEHGLGLPRDVSGAVDFYRRAARQGEAKAQASLGRLLHSGPDVATDRVEAYYWLRAGAEQGEVTAVNFLAEVESGFTEGEREQMERRWRETPPAKRAAGRLGPGAPVPRLQPVPRPGVDADEAGGQGSGGGS